MSREDFELIKQLEKWSQQKRSVDEKEGLIIEDNTIYEIDLACCETLINKKKQYFNQ